MRGFVCEESGAVTVDWVLLTSALVGVALAAIGVVSGGMGALSNDIDTTISSNEIIQTSFFNETVSESTDGVFDLANYVFLSDSGGFVSWQENTLPLLDEPDEYYHWLSSDFANAMDATNSQRAMYVDDYAVTYAQAQEQGIDLSGYADPNDLRDQVAADLGS